MNTLKKTFFSLICLVCCFGASAQTLTCNNLVHISLDENCTATVGPDQILEGSYSNYNNFTVTFAATGLPLVLNSSHVGQTISAKVTHIGGNSCWGNILVQDKWIPALSCEDHAVDCDDSTTPTDLGFPVAAGVVVIPAGANTWTLIGHDPCGPATLVSSDVLSGDLCAGTRKIVRTWTATDGSGNATSCTETISIAPTTIADVIADLPANITLECGAALPPVMTEIGCSNIGIALDGTPNVINICDGSFKVLRKYILVDWCDNSTFTYTQIIKVLDTEAPVFTCGPDITISTNSNSCFGATQLPSIPGSFSDCSNNVTFTKTASQGTLNGNLLTNLPLGPTTVTYTAEDACGNESTCSYTITVKDEIVPIAICDEYTIVGLGSNGLASIPATTFDDGSFDNCGITQMLVRRMDNPACSGSDGTSFAASVPFSCCDKNTIVMVEFQVKDAAGNVNSCMVEVEVQDKINPTVICPSNKNVDCSATYLDYIVVGQPLPAAAILANGAANATDNCSGVVLTNNVVSNTVNCGAGIITIAWTATDAGGRTSSCIQRYFVANNDPFYINVNNDLDPNDDVVWPLDYTATTCGTGLEPDDLSSPYNYPVINEGECNNVAVGHEDLVLIFGVGDACMKILRKWYIIDWCQAQNNQDPTVPGPGVWHYTQVIKVINSSDPTVTVINFPSVIDNYDSNCGNAFAAFPITVDDDCTAPANIVVTWVFSRVVSTNPEVLQTISSGAGLSASGAFANGSYKLVYTVKDGCGNTVWKTHYFTVKDSKKPTPVCIFGLATTVMPSSGTVTIWASDFESGSSYDNCTAYDNLHFSFSQNINNTNITIACADIPSNGLYPVTLYVTDAAGNFDFCSTFINVQDPNGACGSPTALINGIIENENEEVIEDVTVSLSNNTGMNLPVVTGVDGTYEFGIGYGAYDVTPEKNINYLNGVTTFDLVLISKHILGTQLLDSPYKLIAADANNSKTITVLDIVKLRALILHIDDELANNTSWRFVDANHVFGTNVFDFPEYVALDGQTFDPVNFIAVKVGDVNGTASPNSLLGSDTRIFDGNLTLSLEASQVTEGETFTVDFRASEFKNIEGFQFTLGFDNSAVEFVDVKSNLVGLSANNFGLTKLNEGVITISWNSSQEVTVANDDVLFSIIFVANKAVSTKELLSINSRYTESEAYSNSDLYNVVLEFNGSTVSSGFELFQNVPNPFKAETTIGFNMPQAGAVTLTIYDVSGRVLRLIEIEAVKGANSVNVSREGIDATGVLYYQLETATETATKKMILVD